MVAGVGGIDVSQLERTGFGGGIQAHGGDSVTIFGDGWSKEISEGEVVDPSAILQASGMGDIKSKLSEDEGESGVSQSTEIVADILDNIGQVLQSVSSFFNTNKEKDQQQQQTDTSLGLESEEDDDKLKLDESQKGGATDTE
ncbi:MAG: hypothetical protein E7Z90_06780 [Cyanobacteria bacterium SIG29]|nr:hypothetical protein [Cyanobacteria bacterium SIG29]